MFRKLFALSCAVLLVALNSPAQSIVPNGASQQEPTTSQKTSPTQPQQASADDVVRITSKLVQLDLVVTDKSGAQITDLKAEDFEIFEDGRPQPVTHFSYIWNGPSEGSSSSGPGDTRSVASGPSAPGAPRRESVRRTIAIVVDDLGMSYVTTVSARNALRKFVSEQIQPGDLVAIIRTGGGIGALQQFTTNKQQLLSAIDRMRFHQCSRLGISAVAPITSSSTTIGFPGWCAIDSWDFSVDALKAIISGMRELPGRKSLILFSDIFPIDKKELATSEPGSPSAMMAFPQGVTLPASARNSDSQLPLVKTTERIAYGDPLRRLGELAIRSSVVIYGVDTRGLQTLSIGAADQISGGAAELTNVLDSRTAAITSGRTGSALLAEQTGGLMIQNTNDLNLGLRRIMDDQKGYYLLGYRPGDDTFNRRFHKITARVRTRSDLTVRTRNGFYGVTEEDSRPAQPTTVDRFQMALTSPFAVSEINVQLTPVFTSLPGIGPVLRSKLHINARDLAFNQEPDGWRTAQLVLRGLLFGDNGQIVDEHRLAFTVRLRGATFERVQSQGFDYVFNMPAKKPGAYQFRIALLDTSASRVGSAGQFIEIPDLKQKRLALSGIVLNAVEATDPEAAQSVIDTTEGPPRIQEAQANSGARRFHRNTSVDYDYLVFNAAGDRAAGKLTSVVRLYREGKVVFEHEAPAELTRQIAASQFLVGGRLKLGGDLAPGDYVLEITVTDPLAKKGQAAATQLVDFELVE